MSALRRVLQPTQLSTQPNLDKATMHPTFPDVAPFSLQKWCFSLGFSMPHWITGRHRDENLGDLTYCLCCLDSLSVVAPSRTGTLRPMPLDSTGLNMNIHRCFCHGHLRHGTLVPQCLSSFAYAWCRCCFFPPLHAVGTQLPSVWELMGPLHYGGLYIKAHFKVCLNSSQKNCS